MRYVSISGSVTSGTVCQGLRYQRSRGVGLQTGRRSPHHDDHHDDDYLIILQLVFIDGLVGAKNGQVRLVSQPWGLEADL